MENGKWSCSSWSWSWSWSCINNSCCAVQAHLLPFLLPVSSHCSPMSPSVTLCPLSARTLLRCSPKQARCICEHWLPCLAIKRTFYGTIQPGSAEVVIEYATTTASWLQFGGKNIFNFGNNFRNAIKIISASCSSQIQIYLTTNRRFIFLSMFTCCSCMFAARGKSKVASRAMEMGMGMGDRCSSSKKMPS